jgi:ketosteroid isomerase-like protein
MMNIDPSAFAAEWCAGWNSRDLDRVLAHFHDDVIFTSPIAASLLPETGGLIRGKAALRAYWEDGLRRIPNLHFTVEGLFVGIDTLVIQYRNQKGIKVAEALIFDGGLVREGHGTYPSDAEDPAGANS